MVVGTFWRIGPSHLVVKFTSVGLFVVFRHCPVGASRACSGSLLLYFEGESHSVMSDSLWHHGLCSPWNSPGQNTGVGNRSLLQGIFSTQRSNPGLPHRRWILYQLSHQGSPWILEWVACPFFRGSSRPSDRTGVSCTAGRFFTSWATREAHFILFLIWIISILSFFFVSFARGLSTSLIF